MYELDDMPVAELFEWLAHFNLSDKEAAAERRNQEQG